MGSMSIWHWLVVLAIVILLFGRGRLSDIMGEFGKGVSSFKKGMSDADRQLPAGDPTVTANDPAAARTEAPTRQG